jgi:hypothetical protein
MHACEDGAHHILLLLMANFVIAIAECDTENAEQIFQETWQ